MDRILHHVSWIYSLLQTAGDALHTWDVLWHFTLFLLVDGACEGISEGDGSEEHFNADDEVLPARCHGAGADLLAIDEERVGYDAAALQDGEYHSLPER